MHELRRPCRGARNLLEGVISAALTLKMNELCGPYQQVVATNEGRGRSYSLGSRYTSGLSSFVLVTVWRKGGGFFGSNGFQGLDRIHTKSAKERPEPIQTKVLYLRGSEHIFPRLVDGEHLLGSVLIDGLPVVQYPYE